MFLGLDKSESMCITIDNITVKASREVKLLGIKIDNKLNFISHTKEMCTKSNQESRAPIRNKYLTIQKARFLFNAYILSIFNYCPLVWMFCSRSTNKLI